MQRDGYLHQLDTALHHIDRAIEALLKVDGMEDVVEELGVLSAAVETEIQELESLGDE